MHSRIWKLLIKDHEEDITDLIDLIMSMAQSLCNNTDKTIENECFINVVLNNLI